MDSPSNLKPIIALGTQMLERSYSPYSGLKSSAVVISKDGSIHGGCHIENANYPSSISASASAIVNMVTQGHTSLQTVYIFSDNENFLSPSETCTQIILEFTDGDIPIILLNKKYLIRKQMLSLIVPGVFNIETT